MQVLVQLTPNLPDSLGGEELQELFTAERQRAFELLGQGKVVRMWRVMGTRAGISLWDVESQEEFHAALSSLPAWKYCSVEITPVIQHPLESEFLEGEQA